MAKKKSFVSHSELIKSFTFTTQNPFVQKTIEQYGWNCPGGFVFFQKVARLTEINAPAIVLKDVIHRMELQFKAHGFSRNEIARVKKWLYDEYPELKKKVSRVKLPKDQV